MNFRRWAALDAASRAIEAGADPVDALAECDRRMMVNRLFVNGPEHGKILSVKDGRQRWMTVTPIPADWLCGSVRGEAESVPRHEVYERLIMVIDIPGGTAMLEVFAKDGRCEKAEIMHALAIAAGLLKGDGTSES